MSEKNKPPFLTLLVDYPKVDEKSEKRKLLFNNIYLLLEKNKETFPAKTILKKKGEEIIIDSDDFMFSIELKKPLLTRIMLNDPNKNASVVNAIGNSIFNILNTVLGEQANISHVSSTIVFYLKELSNLPIKIVGTVQIAKINEIAKEMLTPTAIGIEFKKGNYKF